MRIEISGPYRGGKSTLLALIYKHLVAKGYSVNIIINDGKKDQEADSFARLIKGEAKNISDANAKHKRVSLTNELSVSDRHVSADLLRDCSSSFVFENSTRNKLKVKVSGTLTDRVTLVEVIAP